jgi:hypothetical protein
MRFASIVVVLFGLFHRALPALAAEPISFDQEIAPLFKRHCVKCHGPSKQEGKLNLSVSGGLIQGGGSGAAVIPHDADGSLVWQRVNADEMPPDTPLSRDEKQLLKQWIIEGTPGLKRSEMDDSEHWAFQALTDVPSPEAEGRPNGFDTEASPVDRFLLNNLSRVGLSFLPEADRYTQIRRVSFDVVGLPPTTEDIQDYINDSRPDAYLRMVDRYLASPHFGERLGKIWLDAAGYADSNGYFNADSDRPLAYRYRDYVIRALNADKPYDQFIREQIAGDELAGINARPGETILPQDGPSGEASAARIIELIEATHYLRNGQDGTGESDGNPDEVRIDRYTVLETTMQNISTGLMGLTIQCAKCHDHKFEPLTQRDYYSFEAILIPAFPPEHWMKPNDRIVYASLPGEMEVWKASLADAESKLRRVQDEITLWVKENRPRGTVLFSDNFEGASESIQDRWNGTAPADIASSVTNAVKLNSREAPSALISEGRLLLIEGGAAGDKCLATRQTFDWSPDIVGAAIQVTFDLVENKIENSAPAERIGYLLALNGFQADRTIRGGNVLVDGHPSAGTIVHTDYPGVASKSEGTIGKTGYAPGRNYGVRVTKIADKKYQIQHLVDGIVEDPAINLTEADLPSGAFGFEYCCGRSFVVDNVVVESFVTDEERERLSAFMKDLAARRQPLDEAAKAKVGLTNTRPGKIAWSTDIVDQPPPVHVFERGNYGSPAELVEPAGFAILDNQTKPAAPPNPEATAPKRSSGRRLAFANWLTEANSKRASLIARVHANRVWQLLFGIGIVASADNFGLSGPIPSHPELLNWLAADLTRSDWSTKRSLRTILTSAAYRQSSVLVDSPTQADRFSLDADGRRLSRFPIRRLDAEAIRDSLLAASGDLDDRLYGPYIPTTRAKNGETIVGEDNPGGRRRSLYLQQRRTQVHSLLQVFDAPSIVFNSTRRPRSTMPLQSLSLLNSEFVVARSKHLAEHLVHHLANDSDRIQQAFLLTIGRAPTEADIAVITSFLQTQLTGYGEDPDATIRAWSDLSQALLIGNAALYIE